MIVLSATVAVFAFNPSLLNIQNQKTALSNKKAATQKKSTAKFTIAEKNGIMLNGGDMTLAINEAYVEPCASVSINGYPISDPCKIERTFDVTKPGIYEISYSFKEKKVIRKVTAADQIKPVIQLKGTSKMVLSVNDKFTDPGFSATDNLDGDLTSKVTTSVL